VPFIDTTPARGLEHDDVAQLIGTKSREAAPKWKRSLSVIGEKIKAWLVSDSRDKDAGFVETKTEKKHWTEL